MRSKRRAGRWFRDGQRTYTFLGKLSMHEGVPCQLNEVEGQSIGLMETNGTEDETVYSFHIS